MGLIHAASEDHEPTDCLAVQRFLDCLITLRPLHLDMTETVFRTICFGVAVDLEVP